MLIYLQMIETPEDQAKFEAVYLEYKGLMFHIANGILHHEQDAEDAVHNAFVAIAEHMEKVGVPVSPKTKSYVATIAESRAIDILRKNERFPCISLDEVTIGVQFEYFGSNGLSRCITKLPVRMRHILVLKHLHGFDNREVAKLLDITYSNTIKTEQRAKARLETLCAEEGIHVY